MLGSKCANPYPSSLFLSSYIKVNVNYPLLLSISQSSIIQNVIEKHYLNPVLTEIQALSFPQGRHNWIPPEATAAKYRARGESRLSVVVFCILCVPIFTFLFQGLQSDPTAEVSQLIDSRTITWECLEVGKKVFEYPSFTEWNCKRNHYHREAVSFHYLA